MAKTKTKKKPKTTPTKVDNAEGLGRVTYVHQMMLVGKNSNYIVQHCAELWHIKERGIRKYITRALALIKEKNIDDRDFNLKKTIDSLENIKGLAMSDKDYKAAVSCDKECSELLGLKNKDINVNLRGAVATTKLTPEELLDFSAAMVELNSDE